MQHLVRLILTLVILVSGTVLVPLAQIPADSFQWQKYTETYECSEKCLVVTGITLDANPVGQKFAVLGLVTVRDENGQPVPHAAVSATWKLPNGSTFTQRMETDNGGVAEFQATNRAGTFSLSINMVKKGGFAFDPDNSLLWNSITTP